LPAKLRRRRTQQFFLRDGGRFLASSADEIAQKAGDARNRQLAIADRHRSVGRPRVAQRVILEHRRRTRHLAVDRVRKLLHLLDEARCTGDHHEAVAGRRRERVRFIAELHLRERAGEILDARRWQRGVARGALAREIHIDGRAVVVRDEVVRRRDRAKHFRRSAAPRTVDGAALRAQLLADDHGEALIGEEFLEEIDERLFLRLVGHVAGFVRDRRGIRHAREQRSQHQQCHDPSGKLREYGPSHPVSHPLPTPRTLVVVPLSILR